MPPFIIRKVLRNYFAIAAIGGGVSCPSSGVQTLNAWYMPTHVTTAISPKTPTAVLRTISGSFLFTIFPSLAKMDDFPSVHDIRASSMTTSYFLASERALFSDICRCRIFRSWPLPPAFPRPLPSRLRFPLQDRYQ